jgi:adenosine deaminase
MRDYTDPQSTHRFYQALPKVDLHRHLEGSFRLQTLVDIANRGEWNYPPAQELGSLVQVNTGDRYTSENFLSKFRTLRLFFRSPEIIQRITREAVADAAADNVRYLELRFTPAALSHAKGFPLEEVIDWVIEGARSGEEEFKLKTRLIASVNRHESIQMAEQVARLAAERIDKGLVGLDLAGNEAQFSAIPFAGVFREARQAGLRITAHAGEWRGADSVREAIDSLDAERIGHGVRVLDDPDVTALARERGTAFEVCITSNYQSGVIPDLTAHPLSRMLAQGLCITVNSDDPGISGICLSDEYRIACEVLALPLDTLGKCVLNSARVSFLSEGERKQVTDQINRVFLDTI